LFQHTVISVTCFKGKRISTETHNSAAYVVEVYKQVMFCPSDSYFLPKYEGYLVTDLLPRNSHESSVPTKPHVLAFYRYIYTKKPEGRMARKMFGDKTSTVYFDVFSTAHHSIDIFHLPNLMHNSFIH